MSQPNSREEAKKKQRERRRQPIRINGHACQQKRIDIATSWQLRLCCLNIAGPKPR
uniref:Uncharacterized protein n=1 Tax=Arundo donax TaxID=35708 RepID=A0A0A9BBI6_ARUDO